MPTTRRLVAHATLATLAALAHAPACLAQAAPAYPTRPITIVVPFSAGGGVDAMARLLADRLRGTLGQSVIVDNKPGASGMLGAGYVAKAAGDGYTLLLGSAGETAINPLVYKGRMQYQPERDLAPISLVALVPNVLVVAPQLPVKNMAELVAYAKARPGAVTYATSGVGNPQHLNGEQLGALAQLRLSHVPYKGASNQLVDVASGTVDFTFVSYAGAAPFIKGGRVRAIAVTSPRRASFAPDIPAIAETVPGYDLSNWFGLFAPASTPAPLVKRLNEAVQQALHDPELARRLREQGGEPTPQTPEQFRQFIQAQVRQYGHIVDAAKIVAE